jgi:protein-S-isoprenylcysteine O-methyltransferase Ste14
MGRHGRILEVRNESQVRVSLGHSLGLKKGDRLCLFEERRLVGEIILTEISENTSLGDLVSKTAPINTGQTVTEYRVATQAVYFGQPFLYWFEIGVLLLSVFFYILLYHKHRQSPFQTCGPMITARLKGLYEIKGVRFPVQLILGFFLVWFLSNVLINALLYFSKTLWPGIRSWSGEWLPQLSFGQGLSPFPLYLLGGLWVISFLLKRTGSPVLYCWNLFTYHRSLSYVKGFPRDGMIWLLQCFIFYAFGANLVFFISGNLAEIAKIAWPSLERGLTAPFQIWDVRLMVMRLGEIGRMVEYMVGHRPDFWSVEIFFLILRYLLWTATCISCLLAYLHSVVSIFWGFRIRNLDFTVLGWFTNGVCYPLFGFLIWPMVPSMAGLDPTITGGPWFYFMLGLDFYFNLLYTLSIWNLGLKFGVMTDKGVRTSGFYSIIRHPNYTLEAPMFLMVEMIGLTSIFQWFSAAMWFLLYYLRSEREDHFMSQSNPDYLIYKEKTPYKFLPGVY